MTPQPATAGTQKTSELTLRGLTKMFIAALDDYSDDKIAHLDLQLCRLIEIVGREARVELSGSLAPIVKAPPRAVRRLAFDEDIAVAGSAISQSLSLTAEDLVRLARIRGPEHLAAICKRPRLDAAVTDVLLERGGAAVAHELAAHAGADISTGGFGLLITRAAQDGSLAVRLAARQDMPIPALKALLSYVDERTRARILAGGAGSSGGETTRRVPEHVVRSLDPARHDFTAACAEIRSLRDRGALTTADVRRLAETGRREQTVAAVSLLAGAPVDLVDRLFRLANDTFLLVACRAAELDWPTVAAVLRLCAMGRPISADRMDDHRLAYLEMTCSAARSILRHWVVRGPSAAESAGTRLPRAAVGRRREPRRQVRISGAVIFPDGRRIADCTIVDISAGGAKMVLAHQTDVPGRFVLLLPTNGGSRRACEVMWRAGNAMGVRFEQASR